MIFELLSRRYIGTKSAFFEVESVRLGVSRKIRKINRSEEISIRVLTRPKNFGYMRNHENLPTAIIYVNTNIACTFLKHYSTFLANLMILFNLYYASLYDNLSAHVFSDMNITRCLNTTHEFNA